MLHVPWPLEHEPVRLEDPNRLSNYVTGLVRVRGACQHCWMTNASPHIFFNSSVDLPEDWRQVLAPHLGTMEFEVGPQCADPEAIDIALLYELPARGLHRFKNLKAVISLSAGINQFRQELMPPGVPLSRAVDPGLTRHMVAYAKAAVYRYHRRFDEYERLSRKGVWHFEPPKANVETVVGVMGLGEIGGAIASGLADDGFTVHGWSRSPKAMTRLRTVIGPVGLEAMVACCDIVINVLPLTAETEGILSAKLFAHFKPGAHLVNIGRGGHLVENDLLEAVERGRIAGATLDVVRQEPLPADHPFWGDPRILITPHVGGFTSPEGAAPQVAENVRRAMRGDPLLYQVDLSRGY